MGVASPMKRPSSKAVQRSLDRVVGTRASHPGISRPEPVCRESFRRWRRRLEVRQRLEPSCSKYGSGDHRATHSHPRRCTRRLAVVPFGNQIRRGSVAWRGWHNATALTRRSASELPMVYFHRRPAAALPIRVRHLHVPRATARSRPSAGVRLS
jgi:hypothetical protein